MLTVGSSLVNKTGLGTFDFIFLDGLPSAPKQFSGGHLYLGMGLWNKLFPHTLTWPELGLSHPCSEDLSVKESVLYNRCAGKRLTPTVRFCLTEAREDPRRKRGTSTKGREKMMRSNHVSNYFQPSMKIHGRVGNK